MNLRSSGEKAWRWLAILEIGKAEGGKHSEDCGMSEETYTPLNLRLAMRYMRTTGRARINVGWVFKVCW